ncbi:MAG: hypothetical protein ACQERG_03880 [Pseudomonadota bacterium]
MARMSLEQVRPGMVLASPVMGANQRVLLRAGVRLTRKHLQSLASLGFTQLDIRQAEPAAQDEEPAEARPQRRRTSQQQRPRPSRPAPRPTTPRRERIADKPILDHVPDEPIPERAREVMSTLEVSRPASRSLHERTNADPETARQARAISESLLAHTRHAEGSALGEALQRAAARRLGDGQGEEGAGAAPQPAGEAEATSDPLEVRNDALKDLIAGQFGRRPS